MKTELEKMRSGELYSFADAEVLASIVRAQKLCARLRTMTIHDEDYREVLDASYIKIITGYKHLFRRLIYNGHIEVSYDGQTFEEVGKLSNGLFVLRPQKGIHALRIISDGISDAEEYVIIQPLEIK